MLISIEGAVEVHEGDILDLRMLLLGLQSDDVVQVQLINRVVTLMRKDVSFVRHWLINAEQLGWSMSPGELATAWLNALQRDKESVSLADVIDKSVILFSTLLMNEVQ